MRYCYSIALLCCAYVTASVAQLKTTDSGNHVTAIIDPNAQGLITIREAIGELKDAILSYPQKSMVYVMVGEMIFTNNHTGQNISNDQRFGGFLDNGVSQKIQDTIRTIWPNKNGCDIIQDVYPVDLGTTAQIVMRWRLKNKTASPVWGQVQFLLDLQVGSASPNNGSPTLTRFSFRPIWEKFEAIRKEDMPQYFFAFENTTSNGSPGPGVTALGYTEDMHYNLGLVRPASVTIGDWGNPFGAALVDVLWGLSPAAPLGQVYMDPAILYQWQGMGVDAGSTEELGSTSYGTGKVDFCQREAITGLFFPQHLFGIAEPEMIVEGYIFIADDNINAYDSVVLSLHAGPNLRITAPITSDQKVQHQVIAQHGGRLTRFVLGTASWKFAVDSHDCDGIFSSWFKLTAAAKRDQLVVDTCELPVTIDCDDPPPLDVYFATTDGHGYFDLLGNPALGQTFVQLTLERPEDITITITDIRGVVQKYFRPGILTSGRVTIPITTQTLSAGTYYVIAEWGGKRYAKKLTVIK